MFKNFLKKIIGRTGSKKTRRKTASKKGRRKSTGRKSVQRKKAPKLKRAAPLRKRKKPQKKESFTSVIKHEDNPIIAPDPAVTWRAWQTFNPAALYLDNKVHLLYRAIGNDGVSRFGYANSRDGFHIDEHPEEPAYREYIETATEIFPYTPLSGGSFAGCEDPRMVYIPEDKTVYITYTSCVNGLRVALSSISRDDFLAKRWRWSRPRHISAQNEVHKNWVLFPEKIRGKYAIIHALNPVSVAYTDDLNFDDTYIHSHYNPGTDTDRWDSYIRGAGPPPIKTEYGWLLFYHAMHRNDMSEYKVGAMLLDTDDPTKVLHRAHAPVLTPEESYETAGYKSGVVYLLGAVVKDGMLLLYYGGADSYVCVAYTDLNEFLSEMHAGATPRLVRKKLTRAVKK